MKYSIVPLLLSLFLAAVSAEDLMAVCYSFTHGDACTTNGSVHENRRMLAKQGNPHPTKRRLLECGGFCEGWSTFCAEYLCDANTLGMTCDDVIAEAKVHMEDYAETVGTEECKKQMSGENLQCMCVDQDGV